MHMQRTNSTKIQAINTVIIVAQLDNTRNTITKVTPVSKTCADIFVTSSFTARPQKSLERHRQIRPENHLRIARAEISVSVLFRRRENEREKLGNHGNSTICTVNRFVATISRGQASSLIGERGVDEWGDGRKEVEGVYV